MKKRLWLRRVIIVIILALIGAAIWMKMTVDDQPTEHADPGIPEVEGLPDPEDVE